MSYRFLATADVHCGNTLPHARRIEHGGIDVYTDRLMETVDVLGQMSAYATENGITDLWYSGDLIDKRLIDAATFKAVTEKLLDVSALDLNQFLIPGNHEAQDAAATMYTLRGFEGVRPNIQVLDETSQVDMGGLRFRCVPYKPDSLARAEIARLRDEIANEPTVLFFHQSIVGGKVGEWVNPDGVTLEDLEGFKLALAGHFHTPQQIEKAPVHYLGAPVQHNFGDAGEERGFWDITVDAKRTKMVKVALKTPRFHVFDWASIKAGPAPSFARGDYVQLNIRGTAAQLKADEKDVENVVDGFIRLGAREVKRNLLLESERKSRAKVVDKDGKRMGWPAAIAGYVDACDVTGLTRARLEALAREAISEAER